MSQSKSIKSDSIIICTKEEAGITNEQIVELLHESFQERLKQGLNFTCSFIDAQQYAESTKNGKTFVAIDADKNLLVGTGTISLLYNRKCRYGYTEYLAINSCH
ncbi:MAG: hypothetical protein IJ604_00665 [Prevotella sp.]|nr:hypothetical protein [Prevotella sp.]